MGIAIPQLAPASLDRASGAQVIDGSLKFNGTSNYLTRSFGSGNRKTWTWSGWVKRDKFGVANYGLFSYYPGSGNGGFIRFSDDDSGDTFRFVDTGNSLSIVSKEKFRDTGWYHIVIAADTTQGIESDRIKRYVNGVRQLVNASNTWPSENDDLDINQSGNHYIGRVQASAYGPVSMSNVYFIDGLALGPEYFGFTDPLTGTWRPKKFRAEGTTYNDGTVWSSGSTVTGGTISNADKGFDGSLSSSGYAELAATDSNTTANVKFAVNFKNVTKVEVFVHSASGSGDTRGTCETPNGVTFTSATLTGASQSFHTIYEGEPITLKNIGWGINQNGATGTGSDGFRAFRINGEILIDSTTRNLAFGTNGFYLPFDGSAPIGQDKSGKGNDWTPVNFGGSVALDNPQVSGARPILNTTQGGTQAGIGVFGSKANKTYTVTYADDGGGNKYYIDGVKQATLTGLIRGATYTFNTVSLGSTHPFRLSATSAHGTEYTNGVVAITGAATTITIPYNAPNALYYYCTAHSGMGSSITGITTNEKLADQYASNCVLAVPGVGGNYTDVSAQINCTSTTKASSAGGDPSSDSSSNFYGSSIDLDGNDKVTYTRTNAGDFSGQSDFTIEAWFNTDTTGATDAALFSNWDSGNNRSILFGPNASGAGKFTFIFNTTGSGSWTTVANPTAYAGKWVHVAWVYDHSATRHYAYINGILEGSATGTAYNNSTANFLLGVNKGDGSGYYDGKVQDLRYYHAVKYTASGTTAGEVVFTPPSINPDILPDTPSGVATKSKLKKITDGAVSFDGSGDSLQVIDSSDLAFGTGEFTVEMFFYANTVSGNDVLYDSRASTGSPTDGFSIVRNNDQLRTYTSGEYKITPLTFRVASNRWYHLAITRESTTQKMYIDGELVGSATVSNDFSQNKATIGSDVNKSENWDGFISNVRLIKGTALYTSKFTPPTAPLTNVTNTKLLCCQSPSNVKLSPVAPTVGTTANTRFNSNFESIPTTVNSLTVTNNGSVSTTSAGTNSYGFTNCADLSGSNSLSVNLGAIPQVTTIDIIFKVTGTSDNKYLFAISNTGLVRRTGSSLAWYNNDGDQTISTTPDDGEWHHLRVTPKSLYFDGVETKTTSTTPNIYVSANGYMALGAYRNDSGTIQYNGAVDIGLVRVMPGVDLGAPSSIPITTNGTLSSTETIPNDGVIFAAANSAATNFNPFNTDINTVRGQETGYATLNPLNLHNTADTLSEGNLKLTSSGSGAGHFSRSTITMSSGKYFCEVKWLDVGQNFCGLQGNGDINYNNSYVYLSNAKASDTNGSSEDASYGSTWTTGDTIGVAYDADNKTLEFFKNGVSQGVAFTNITGTYDPNPTEYVFFFGNWSAQNATYVVNFGQKPFKFPPPDGFQPLNNANTRPVKVIARPDQFVGVTTYTGTGSSKTLSDYNHKPDFVWIKRTNGAGHHSLFDSVRGATEIIYSNLTNAENTIASSLSTFNDKGFTVVSDNDVNGSGGMNYVAYGWKAGGGKSGGGGFFKDDVEYGSAAAAGITGLDGTGEMTTAKFLGCSIGAKQGFSIIKYRGLGGGDVKVPHGLSQTPNMVIVKNIDSSVDWAITHSGLPGNRSLRFTTASTSTSGFLGLNKGGLAPSYFTINYSDTNLKYVNASNENYIAYCWHDVPGLQKFGQFTGNNDADGVFVELGFKPAILLLKNDAGTGDWIIWDNERNKTNPVDRQIWPYTNSGTYGAYDQVASSYPLDFLSNGFKMRTNDADMNGSSTYIYAAWAEHPLSNLYGATSNAR